LPDLQFGHGEKDREAGRQSGLTVLGLFDLSALPRNPVIARSLG
jgi:hypothetical protein